MTSCYPRFSLSWRGGLRPAGADELPGDRSPHILEGVRNLLACALVVLVMRTASADPATAPSSTFCSDRSPVERIDAVLVCRDGGQRYAASSTRDRTGWSYQRADGPVPFSRDESAHTDRELADGVAKLCRGANGPRILFPSMHRRELGWPLPRCQGRFELVLVKAGSRLELRAPGVAEIADVYWIARLHEFGRQAVWKP